jgi:periplasmic protein TonB
VASYSGYPSGATQRTHSQVAPFATKRQTQIILSPNREEIEESSLFREIDAGANLRRNPWATITAFTFQVLVGLILVLAALYHPEPLPKRQVVTMLYMPPAAQGSTLTTFRKSTPTYTAKSISIPAVPRAPQETQKPPADDPDAVVGGIPGGVVGGVPGGMVGGVLAGSYRTPVLASASVPAPIQRVHIPTRIAEANLIHDVPPKYPAAAGRARIEGTVELMAVIGKDGSVQDVHVESGLPVLAQAAVDAVKQWRYKPYLLNGSPVEVESRITINFTLS